MKTSSGIALLALVSAIPLASAAPPGEHALPRPATLELADTDIAPGRSALELGGPAWTADGGQANAQLGAALASAGDVNGDGYSDVIVGAPSYSNGESGEGRALVYLGSASGLATTPAWTAEGNQVDALFGSSVATAGDINGDGYSDVIVGAYQYDNGQLDEGRAFVYLGSASGLASSPAWTAESDQADALFGGAVATAGDVDGDGYSDVIVGAWAHDNGQTNEGRVFVYLGSPSGLATSASWTAESEQAGAFLGGSVAGVGDVDGDGFGDVVVGASGWQDAPAQANEGRAFLFLGSPSGLVSDPSWTPQANQAGANFGIAVASAGDVNGDGFADVIVGANAYEDLAGETDEGAAFVYLGSASGLAAGPVWSGDGDQPGASFGISVASAGDINGDGFADVVVGARSFDDGEEDEGLGSLYLGRADGVNQVEWTAQVDQTDALLGLSVASAGDVDGDGYGDILVGAPLYDGPDVDGGRAFLYSGAASVMSEQVAWSVEDSVFTLGESLASAGDVNGDGYGDVIVGDPSYESVSPQNQEGRAFLYLGSSSGLATSAAWVVESNIRDGNLGARVASAGDVNGDGYGDVVIGGRRRDVDPHGGVAWLYLGSPSGLATSAAWTVTGGQTGAGAYVVASAGDVNGDGYGDVFVGAPRYDEVGTNRGQARVFLGSPAGLSQIPAWTVTGEDDFFGFGSHVANGDIDGDGYGDLVVAAHSGDRAYAYHGSAQGLSTIAAWSGDCVLGSENFEAGSAFGMGDVDGDGYSDLFVSGTVLFGISVHRGSSSTLSTLPTWTLDYSGAPFGRLSANSAADVNGDGFTDIAVATAPGGFPPGSFQTLVLLHLGSASGPSAEPVWITSPFNVDEEFLDDWQPADVNGDGYGDLILSSRDRASFGHPRRAWNVQGNEGSGWTRAPEQRTSDGARPIALHGRSDEPSSFGVRLRFEQMLAGFRWASPAVPTARLEWEVVPLGVALDGSAIESGAPQAITGAPLVFDELGQLGSSAGKPFHWRARIRTNNPLFPVTPWTWLSGNGVSEAKLRRGTMDPPSPGVPVPVAAGRPKRP